MRYIIAFILVVLLIPSVDFAATTTTTVTNYIYPLAQWSVSTHQGEDVGGGLYHMGVDVGSNLPAGAPVYAVANGIVREAQVRSQFGLVVLIEHSPMNEAANVSLYGHLSPSHVLVKPGQTVQAGDEIGVLGTASENGGWPVHLHFGIHKGAYTGQWVYYGHVHDTTEVANWDDPETYIPAHLIADTWLPTVAWPETSNQLIDNTFTAPTIGDVGSGVATITYSVSQDQGSTWQILKKLSLKNYPDGTLQLKAVAQDHFSNTGESTVTVIKDVNHFSDPVVWAIPGNNAVPTVSQWSKGKTLLNSFPVSSTLWHHGGDIALGDNEVIVGHGSYNTPGTVQVYDFTSALLQTINAFPTGAVHVTTGDVNGDGTADIVAAANVAGVPTIAAYSFAGAQLWQTTLPNQTLNKHQEVDVAVGDVNHDGKLEVVVGTTTVNVLASDGSAVLNIFQPFSIKCINTINVAAATGMIVAGSSANCHGAVKIFNGIGEQQGITFYPFGKNNVSPIDVSTAQYDTGTDVGGPEIVMSQSAHGQAWVKIYRNDATQTVLWEQKVNDASFVNGARIVGL